MTPARDPKQTLKLPRDLSGCGELSRGLAPQNPLQELFRGSGELSQALGSSLGRTLRVWGNLVSHGCRQAPSLHAKVTVRRKARPGAKDRENQLLTTRTLKDRDWFWKKS